jgi:hypothetical protein
MNAQGTTTADTLLINVHEIEVEVPVHCSKLV